MARHAKESNERRFLLMQIAVSALVLALAVFIVVTTDERGFLWWLGVVVIVTNAIQILWNLNKFRRLPRANAPSS